MNKLNPRYKILLRINKKISNKKLLKLNKRKWNFFKKLNKNTPEKQTIKIQPDEKKKFFKERLLSKQQLKFFYGCISEYKLKNIIKNLKIKKTNINILENFIILLESRLDIVLFRLKIDKTVFGVKQLINHGKIKVNNKIIYSSNYILKKGDIISFNNSKISFLRLNKINYLEFNNFLKIIIFLRKPLFKEIEYPFFLNLKSIYEYYKK